jgi:hypothetical protein
MDPLFRKRDGLYLSSGHIRLRRSPRRGSRSSIVQLTKLTQNNMKESLALFDQICNSQWFQKTSMILFLNKIDIFQAKLKYSSVKTYFPDFRGYSLIYYYNGIGDERDYLQTSRYFQKKFIRLNKSSEKEVYTHFTNATGSVIILGETNADTQILRNVMDSVQDTIMNNNFRHLLL